MTRHLITIVLALCGLTAYGQERVAASISFPSGEWMEPLPVSIKINKGTLTGFGKVHLSIDQNVDVSPISRSGATFSHSKGQVKFLWMDMPSGDIEVTMLVQPPKDGSKEVSLSGAFYCLDENGQQLYAPVAVQSYGGKKAPSAEPVAVTPARSQPAPQPDVADATSKKVIGTGATNKDTPSGPVKAVSEPVAPPASVPMPKPRTAPVPVAQQEVRGLVFRAQLSAQQTYSAPGFVGTRLGMKGEVHYDNHDGWHKYTTGEFTNYRAAKVYANELRETNKVPGSFVVGFEDGQRITIQRAIQLAK